MLVNSIDVIKYNGGFAPAINVPSLTALRAVIETAEEENVGVIIQHAESHENFISREEAVAMMRWYAKKSKVPVAVHFDHGTSYESCLNAMELGFTSVMYDGSKLPLQENIANSIKVVEAAKKYGVSVEAELGAMPDGDTLGNPILYTNVKEAVDFVENTGVDLLAVSIGTAHGVYTTNPAINYQRILELNESLPIPLVMHGGSGLTKEEYQNAMSKGIRKINFYTYMSKAPLSNDILNTVDQDTLFEEVEVLSRGEMKKIVQEFIQIMKGY